MNLDKMTLREVMEKTKNMSISDGGLTFMFEKIVKEIEDLRVLIQQEIKNNDFKDFHARLCILEERDKK